MIISYDEDKNSKLYDYKKNDSFIKDIYRINKYKTNSMIPWSYKDNWYIIDISPNKIYINNLFKDECYSELRLRGTENYLNGFLYKNKYLYVYNKNSYSSILIWDLYTKNSIGNILVYSEIKTMLLWNNNYGIVYTDEGLLTLDMKRNIMLNNVFNQEKKFSKLKSIKKIKLNDLKAEGLVTLKNHSLYLYIIDNEI